MKLFFFSNMYIKMTNTYMDEYMLHSSRKMNSTFTIIYLYTYINRYTYRHRYDQLRSGVS